MPVELENAVALRKALNEYAPELAKETQKQIAGFLKTVVKDARGFLPSNDAAPSGWLKGTQKGKWENRAYDFATASRGITYQTTPSRANRRGFRALASILNKSAAGAIYETAGRKSGIVGKFTPQLHGELKGYKQKMQGRAMFRAWAEDQGRTNAAVIKAIEKSNNEVSRKTKRGM